MTKELKVFGRQKECFSVSGTITNDTTERCADIKDGSFECQESNEWLHNAKERRTDITTNHHTPRVE
ncbi:hypothetical protein [Caldibacillus thermoamylovorans]|uniref:hypothetical protein n=1 Tax=Caldibacillus thermoamylovorans TaxID=35841 RepID=UPI0017EBACBC|nr:hypothetical protein [Caldibacillus thermoamylovorans]NWN97072.1 hypothetical protein [Bacillus sp. (in: firmicutes)]